MGGAVRAEQKAQQSSFLGRRAFVKLMGGGMMLSLTTGLLSGCEAIVDTLDATLEGKRRVVDDAGREVEIPTVDRLERVYFTSALGQIYCFTVAPDLIAGTGLQFTPYELEYLPANTRELPYLGSTSGNGEIDREQLLVENIQVVFSISGRPLTEANISEAKDLQAHTNIPCLCVDGSFEHVAAAYRFLGEIMGAESRAETLALYCENAFATVTAAVADIPESEKLSLYYAEGPEGLQTEPDAAQHALTFSFAGANNVAAVPETEGLGMSNVSLEQVLAWDPEVIVAWDYEVRGGADEMIRTSANWSTIRAVRTGRVYTMPNVPFAWCDRPPGVNRLLGIQWVANMLYPERFDVDMVEVTKDFYSTMYWVDISDEQAKEILGNSYPPYRGQA
jgi:iron complex transport system substrate-binding protein